MQCSSYCQKETCSLIQQSRTKSKEEGVESTPREITTKKVTRRRRKSLDQWFLTFLKSGNTFDYMKNLRNTKINDPKN